MALTSKNWEGDGFLHLLERAAPEQPYASEPENGVWTSRTVGDLTARARLIACGLSARGIGAGDRVALMLGTHFDYCAAVLGLAMLRAVWVPVGLRQIGSAVSFAVSEAQVSLLIAEDAVADVVQEAGCPVLLRPETGLDGVLGGAPEIAFAAPDPSDLMMISFTSGTTGKPKGVPVTHAMLRYSAESAAISSAAEDGAVYYTWEPFHHIGGAQVIILPLIRKVSLALAPRFTASGFWNEVRTTGATRIHHLGGILQMLLKQPPRPDDRYHKVSVAWGGGCDADTWRAVEARFGVKVHEGYGMTEASSLTTVNTEGLPGLVGRPLPWFDVAILDRDGAPVAQGEKGEIVVTPRPGRESALFAGYTNSDEATREALRGGRLFTGDMGSLDAEGRLRFHGRMKDTIRVRGENVSAWEVENVVEQHDGVAACAAIPVKAEIGEADIKIYVQPVAGQQLTGESLFDWLKGRLAPHQLPQFISFVTDFERTPSQRIMKHKLDPMRGGDWTRH
ncbi:AMP-binding protein [Salipiger sp. P9]|uniref:AMP-binding protein n=1 Tax=Salipiger pentaromativorans TaxID=2943193 RepID=UPI0021583D06|nr:AMP-binding protein [Salipiger pentaromativorans]MCR8550521.1 AMP-binding protein [Salipiger pentaromativorans]